MGNPDQLTITGATSEQEVVLREITAWSGVPVLTRLIHVNLGLGYPNQGGATGFSMDNRFIADPQHIGYIFLHEYGHVWDRHWLSIEDRQKIIDLSGSPHSWYGGAYDVRPVEKFADTFAKITMASAGYHVGAPLAFVGSLYDDIAARIAEVHLVDLPTAETRPVDSPFTDISHTSQEMQDAIAWLYGQGITKGTTATTSGPDEPVTRGQMALFLYRALGPG